MAEDWRFWIDRGGTFTDCIGLAPDGTVRVEKILSSDRAPVDAVRRILARAGIPGALPPCRVRLGTTVATNALLTRRGAPTLLVTNRGLGDVLEIGAGTGLNMPLYPERLGKLMLSTGKTLVSG